MSTGGRISSFFSTVAGPFHPFGGAVDIIIVQQQDGSFKSTPWYVRFGKFQGVLKRSENIVTVSVNGVDADFHLYLDNTGEAYLLKEAECCEEEGAASPRSSRSSDEQMLICNGSFKSVMSHPDMDDDCDVEADSEQVNSLMKDSSNACKRNGNIVITISEHGSVTAEKQEVNDLPSRGSEDAIGESSGPKQTLKMVSDTAKESNVNNHVPLVTGSVGASSLDTANEIKKADVEINNGWDSNEKTSVFVMEESLDTYTISRKCSENHSIFLSGYNSYEYEDMEFQQINLPDLKKSENENTEMVLMSVDGHMMRAPITSFKIVDSDALKEEFIEDHNICQGAAENSVDDKDIALSERLKEIDSRTGYAMESVVMDSKEYVEHENEQGVNLDATAYNRNLQCLPTSNTSEEDNLGISDYSVDPSVSHLSTSESNENKNFENVDRKNLGSTTDYEHHGRINGCELTKNESELTLNDDDDLYKSCANFSELCSPMEEQEEEDDEADVRLSPHAEEDEVDDNVAGSIHTIRECDNVSCFQMDRTSPIDVPGSHSRNKDIVEAPGSLPNMISNISAPEMSDSERICSRSLDSSYSSSHRSKIMEVNRTVKSPLESFTSSCYKTVPEDETPQKLDSSYVVQESSEASNERLQLRKAIEISLCRDLLYKGMGAEAAASAFESKRVSKEYFKNSASDILKNEKLVVKIQGRYFPWPAASSIVLGMVVFDLEAPIDNESEILVDHTDSIIDKNKTSDRSSSSPGMWRLWPLPFTFRRPKTPETNSGINARSKSISKAEEDVTSTSLKDEHKKSQHHKVRTKTPSSDQLASLNLKEGQNMITFTYETSVLGKHQVDARIYLWKWNTRIVISDVDGTITKSDVLGQVMPWVGKDWTQTGVARLFSAIKDNGYQLLFLSARAIAQAYLTRQFLLNLKQDGKTLPDGPVVISPDGLFPSLYREVIRRAPHEFKISCLEDIRALFPPDCNPFYAGFGNRDTDEISYLKVGIPKGKIFIINPKGQVVVNHCVDVKSYTSLHKLADDMFPAVFSSEQEDFNSWNFWKVPLPEIED